MVSMSKKSKKAKKPKPLDLKTLSATDIIYYVTHKFEISNEEFWDNLFLEIPYKETVLLGLHEFDIMLYNQKDLNYIRIIRDEFSEYADEDLYIEIINDI